jgi:hypothetical protein
LSTIGYGYVVLFVAMAKKPVAEKAKAKNPAAVALGRLGGAKKVKKGFAMLTKAERRVAAMKGVAARQANARKKLRARRADNG